MTTYNCTSERMTHRQSKHVKDLPNKYRDAIIDLIDSQYINPKRKAEDVIFMLNAMGIQDVTDAKLYVGNNDAKHGGDSIFRQELRRLGFNPVTKINLRGKLNLTDTIKIDSELGAKIGTILKKPFPSPLKTKELEQLNDNLTIDASGFTHYTLNPKYPDRKVSIPDIYRGTIKVVMPGYPKIWLSFIDGCLKYIGYNIDVESRYLTSKDGVILEYTDARFKIHREDAVSFNKAFRIMHRLYRRE